MGRDKDIGCHVSVKALFVSMLSFLGYLFSGICRPCQVRTCTEVILARAKVSSFEIYIIYTQCVTMVLLRTVF